MREGGVWLERGKVGGKRGRVRREYRGRVR